MTPPGPWWGEPAGVLLFFVLPCAAWTVWKLRRDAKQERERLARTVRGYDVHRAQRERLRRLRDETNERRSA